MAETVFTLIETTDRSGTVLGVFATLALALGAARSWARYRIERCDTMDQVSFGIAEASSYRINVSPDATSAEVSIVHGPSGEVDLVRWQVRLFDVVEPPSRPDAIQAELSSDAAECASAQPR